MGIRIFKVFLICLLIGLSFGLYFYFAYDPRPFRIVVTVLSNVIIGCTMMLCIYNSKYLNLITQTQSLKVAFMIGILIIAAVAGTELTFFINSLILGSTYQFLAGSDIYILNILVVLVIGIPIYINEEWKHNVESQVLNQQLQLLQLEQQNTLFELELLRAKVNPHFLYNMHNSIAGLITQDPGKAEKMVLLLSKFFRFTLNKGSSTFHTIADEIEIIKTYLELQRIRYGERLNYAIHVEDDLLHLRIPSYVLQPLVENSIKHGLEKITGTGNIVIDVCTNDEHLNIKVSDSGPAFPDSPGTGTGWHLVNNKLRLLYKENFKMEFCNTPEKYVELVLPKNN